MSEDEIRWSTRVGVVKALLARLSSSDPHGDSFQRALATATELADTAVLAILFRRYLGVATPQVADLLRLACALRGAPLEDYEQRMAIRSAALRIDEDLSKPSPHRRWNNIAGRTCVHFLAAYEPALIREILVEELGGRASSIYASLWTLARNRRPDQMFVAHALLSAWAAAPHLPMANDTLVAIARYRIDPNADHSRLRALYPNLARLPSDEGLRRDEVRVLFGDSPELMEGILHRIEDQRLRRQSVENPRLVREPTGVRAILARAEASAMSGDETTIATLVELARHESRHTRASALRTLVLCGAGHAVYRENARSAEGYHDVRLALHGLARSDNPIDHDLLLASVLNREDGIRHLACLSKLAGVDALDPDAYVDSIANDVPAP